MNHRGPPIAESAGTLFSFETAWARTRVLDAHAIETADFDIRCVRPLSPHLDPHLLIERADAAHRARAPRRFPCRVRARLSRCAYGP